MISVSQAFGTVAPKEEQVALRGIRSMKALLIEDGILTLSAYALLVAFTLSWIPFWAMQVGVLLYVVRVFNLRHERSHLSTSSLTGWQKFASELLEVYHSPWQEPFSEKRRKHLMHHQAHTGKKVANPNNSHALLETTLFQSLFTSFFYHEVMFVLDWRRDGGLSPERKRSLLISTVVLALTILAVGPVNFGLFFVAYRLASFFTWFTFSYVLHIDDLYEHEVGPHLPVSFRKAVDGLLGPGAVTAIFYHQFHHRRPNMFHKF